MGEDGPGLGHLCHTDTFLVTSKVALVSVLKALISSRLHVKIVFAIFQRK